MRCFKLYGAYSILFNSSNAGNLFGSWILKDCIKVERKKRTLSSCVHILTKHEIRHIHIVVGQWPQTNVQKSMMHVQSCYFANLSLFLFCSSRSCHHCLSSLLFLWGAIDSSTTYRCEYFHHSINMPPLVWSMPTNSTTLVLEWHSHVHGDSLNTAKIPGVTINFISPAQ